MKTDKDPTKKLQGIEEEIVLLYALEKCSGGRPTKQQAISYIRRHCLLLEREGDFDVVSSGEERIDNDIAWTRENLKRKGHLEMPWHGTWQITPAGRTRLYEAAWFSIGGSFKEWADLNFIELKRWSPEFLDRLEKLGQHLAKQNEN